jgi:tyrosyl-tRNA synthetase
MQRLSDFRSTLRTLEDAKGAFNDLARLEIELARADAGFEARIAAAKTAHEDKTAAQRAEHQALAKDLSAFIEGNQGMFQDPRKIETVFGSFGLQRVSELKVTDEDAALAACRERRLSDCYKTVTKLVLTALRKRIDKGEVIPGAAVLAGDTAVYRVAKTLLEEARQSAG